MLCTHKMATPWFTNTDWGPVHDSNSEMSQRLGNAKAARCGLCQGLQDHITMMLLFKDSKCTFVLGANLKFGMQLLPGGGTTAMEKLITAALATFGNELDFEHIFDKRTLHRTPISRLAPTGTRPSPRRREDPQATAQGCLSARYWGIATVVSTVAHQMAARRHS